MNSKWLAIILSSLTIMGSAFWAFSSVSEKAGQYTRQITNNTESIRDLRGDIKDISSKTDKIGTDIEWIKDTLKRKL